MREVGVRVGQIRVKIGIMVNKVQRGGQGVNESHFTPVPHSLLILLMHFERHQ